MLQQQLVGDFYYFNFDTGISQWQHPLDEIYRQKVIQCRKALGEENPENQRGSKTLLDPDITEVSGDTSDILSTRRNSVDVENMAMDLKPLKKLVQMTR